MKHSKTWLVVSIFIIAAMVLAACQPAAAPAETIIVTEVVQKEGEQVIVVATAQPQEEETGVEPVVLDICRGTSGDIPTVDPALAWDVISIQIIDETTVGLTRQNEATAENELAMATDYSVSEDGRTFTFTIRDDVSWVKYDKVNDQVVQVLDCEGNPRMVTAHDFEYGIMRTADPATAADYAFLINWFIDGAEAFNAGEAEWDTVGVKALDDTTLEITFLEPSVVNLSIAGLWFMHATPSWLIDGDDCTEGVGDKWIETGFFQGYGPYVMEEWIHDSTLTLAKNPFWPGDEIVPESQIDKIKWTTLSFSSCLAEFEAGNTDVVAIPTGDYDRISTDPVYKEMMFPVATLGTEFYSFNTQLEPTDDVRVRLALSKAIDRETLVQILKSGIPAAWFTNPGAAGAPSPEKYPDLGISYDPEGAKALMDEYLAEKGITAEELNLAMMFNTSEQHKMTAEIVQQMWTDTLGVNIELSNQEWKVYKISRQDGNENIYRSSWVQDYPDANNFVKEVFATGGAYSDVVDWTEGEAFDRFEALATEATGEADPDKRMELYAQAEQILVAEEAVVAPLYWYASFELRRPEFKMEVSKSGYERFEKWQVVE